MTRIEQLFPGQIPVTAEHLAAQTAAAPVTVPDGVPAALTAGQVARVLNLREETVKRALTSGALPSFRLIEGRGWRLVRSADVADLAQRCGLALCWEAVL